MRERLGKWRPLIGYIGKLETSDWLDWAYRQCVYVVCTVRTVEEVEISSTSSMKAVRRTTQPIAFPAFEYQSISSKCLLGCSQPSVQSVSQSVILVSQVRPNLLISVDQFSVDQFSVDQFTSGQSKSISLTIQT